MSAPKRHVPGSQPPSSKPASTSTSSSKNRVIIQLHLNDLRTHDSPVLAHAHSQESSGITHFLPVFVFDERIFALSAIPGYDKSDQKPSSRPRTHRGLGDAPRNSSNQAMVPNPKTRLGGFWKTGRHRTKFTVESVFDLRESYRSKGGDLIVGCGHMEKVVESMVKGLQTKEGGGFEAPEVWMQKEVSTEEVNFQRRLRALLEPLGSSLRLVDSKPMVDPRDLPFDISDTPDLYTTFRKQVEGLGDEMIRPPAKDFKKIKPVPKLPSSVTESFYLVNENLASTKAFMPYILAPLLAEPDLGDPIAAIPIPTSDAEWESYHSKMPRDDPRSAFPFIGGETSALARLDDYLGTYVSEGKITGGEKAKTYKDTRNGLLGDGFSTKFSAWLANGSMSGRLAGWKVGQLLESLHNEGKLDKHTEGNVYWIQFELLWRDYFYYVSQKFSKLRPFATERLRKARKMAPDDPDPSEAGTASTLFNIGGFQEVLKPKESAKVIDSWNGFNLSDPKDKARLFFEGKTGVPFIDAALREISATGYMSNRMRQNVASYFAVDLYVDWRVGAEWFETLLCDHDVCSNSGNWQYQASGVGLDARASRKFNQIKQANDYDLNDEYVKTWIPAIKDLDEMHVQTPWLLPDEKKSSLDYPSQPISEAPEWKKHYRAKNGRGGGGNRSQPGGRNGPGGPGEGKGGGRGGKGGGDRGRGGKHRGGGRGGGGPKGGIREQHD